MSASRSAGLLHFKTDVVPCLPSAFTFVHFHNLLRSPEPGSCCWIEQNVATVRSLMVRRRLERKSKSPGCCMCNCCSGRPRTGGGSFERKKRGHLERAAAACCHHLQPVILTNRGPADDDDHPGFDQSEAATYHRFPGHHKLYNF